MSTTPIAPPSKPELGAGQTTLMLPPVFQRKPPSPLGQGSLLNDNSPSWTKNSLPPSLPSTTMNTQIFPPNN